MRTNIHKDNYFYNKFYFSFAFRVYIYHLPHQDIKDTFSFLRKSSRICKLFIKFALVSRKMQ